MAAAKLLLICAQGIQTWPDNLSSQTHITALSLASNMLTSVSPTVSQLRHLQLLDISRNQLVEVSESIGQLQELARVNLSENRLTWLPATVPWSARVSAADTLAAGSAQPPR